MTKTEKKISGLNYISLSTFLYVIDKLKPREYIVENGIIYEVIDSEERKND